MTILTTRPFSATTTGETRKGHATHRGLHEPTWRLCLKWGRSTVLPWLNQRKYALVMTVLFMAIIALLSYATYEACSLIDTNPWLPAVGIALALISAGVYIAAGNCQAHGAPCAQRLSQFLVSTPCKTELALYGGLGALCFTTTLVTAIYGH